MKAAFHWAFLSILFLSSNSAATADTFGAGDDTFAIEFVRVSSPGNSADTSGRPNPAGSVPYVYRIAKYEIPEEAIDKANALAGLGISKDVRSPIKPATGISWLEAAKFVNWLNTSTGKEPAYKFDESGSFQLWLPADPGYDSSNRYRNKLAKYFLPSESEWYKSAYYDPIGNVYYDYPTGSNNVPDGIDFPGDLTFDVVFRDGGLTTSPNLEPNDIMDAGLMSPNGTVAQAGNVWEWMETEFDLVNNLVVDPTPGEPQSSSVTHALRGASWFTSIVPADLSASSRVQGSKDTELINIGFRIVSIPEPGAFGISLCALPFHRLAHRFGTRRCRNRHF